MALISIYHQLTLYHFNRRKTIATSFGDEKVSSLTYATFSGTNYFLFYVLIGCLQSVYGIHTFRVESIAHGKAAPVDELQVQGVGNPGLLRKVNQRLLSCFLSFCTFWSQWHSSHHTCNLWFIRQDFPFPAGHRNRSCKGDTGCW